MIFTFKRRALPEYQVKKKKSVRNFRENPCFFFIFQNRVKRTLDRGKSSEQKKKMKEKKEGRENMDVDNFKFGNILTRQVRQLCVRGSCHEGKIQPSPCASKKKLFRSTLN